MNEIMQLDEIKTKLADRRLAVVADGARLHYNTLRAIRDGEKTNPTLETMRRLTVYFQEAAQ
jgi:hypothetical protein